jgi:osmotically inducible protein OsmC
MTAELDRIAYTASATATGGRAGHVRSSDGFVDLDLRPPVEMGGPGGATNPEQLFAAGYAACFTGALKLVAGKAKVALPNLSITGHVGIGPAEVGFAIAAKLEISVPGVPKEQVEELVKQAHQVCPYSNATRGNVDVELVVV